MLVSLKNWTAGLPLSDDMLVIGIMILLAFYAGKGIKHLKLPNIIGFMLIGVLLGPSLLNIINEGLQQQLDFITEIALGAVALGMGLELNLRTIQQKGAGVLILIVTQLLLTFFFVAGGVYLLTGHMALALPIGAIATTTGPAGTMAVIQDSGARGPLSRTLYAVLGFDNGMGIVIFGFALAIASSMLARQTGNEADHVLYASFVAPLINAFLSLALGGAVGILSCLLLRTPKEKRGVLIQTVAIILITIGLCRIFELSFIFALLVAGTVVVNTQPAGLLERLRGELTEFMPLLYVFFFALAGAKLRVDELPQVGLMGLVYVSCRSAGKIVGSRLGAGWGGLEKNLRDYVGMALLSQAGVAIGLALIVRSEFSRYGQESAELGTAVLTAITASAVLFELIGPLLAEIALKKAGELPPPDTAGRRPTRS